MPIMSVALALLIASIQPAPAETVPSLDPVPIEGPVEPASPPTAPVLAGDEWDFSYTFVEVGAVKYDVDNADDDVDIYYGRASLELFKIFHVFGEYQNQSTDFANTDTDLFSLGVGAQLGILPKIDVFGEVAWLYNDVSSDLDELDDTNSGYELFAGARWMALPWERGGLEINGGLGYVDLKNSLASDDEAVEWELGARAHFLKLLSVGLTYAMIEDDDAILGNVRVSF